MPNSIHLRSWSFALFQCNSFLKLDTLVVSSISRNSIPAISVKSARSSAVRSKLKPVLCAPPA
jgi:hypothetical protein